MLEELYLQSVMDCKSLILPISLLFFSGYPFKIVVYIMYVPPLKTLNIFKRLLFKHKSLYLLVILLEVEVTEHLIRLSFY